MNISAQKPDERVKSVNFTRNSLIVDLKDGRSISVPLSWYPKLLKATQKQRSHWETCGGGYGIHWPEIDEDLSTSGLLRGSPAPPALKRKIAKKPARVKRRMTKTKLEKQKK